MLVKRLRAARHAGKLLKLRYRHQQHALTFGDEGKNLPRLPTSRRPDGFRDRYLEFAR